MRISSEGAVHVQALHTWYEDQLQEAKHAAGQSAAAANGGTPLKRRRRGAEQSAGPSQPSAKPDEAASMSAAHTREASSARVPDSDSEGAAAIGGGGEAESGESAPVESATPSCMQRWTTSKLGAGEVVHVQKLLVLDGSCHDIGYAPVLCEGLGINEGAKGRCKQVPLGTQSPRAWRSVLRGFLPAWKLQRSRWWLSLRIQKLQTCSPSRTSFLF